MGSLVSGSQEASIAHQWLSTPLQTSSSGSQHTLHWLTSSFFALDSLWDQCRVSPRWQVRGVRSPPRLRQETSQQQQQRILAVNSIKNVQHIFSSSSVPACDQSFICQNKIKKSFKMSILWLLCWFSVKEVSFGFADEIKGYHSEPFIVSFNTKVFICSSGKSF